MSKDIEKEMAALEQFRKVDLRGFLKKVIALGESFGAERESNVVLGALIGSISELAACTRTLCKDGADARNLVLTAVEVGLSSFNERSLPASCQDLN